MKIVTKKHAQVTVLVLSQKSCDWEPPAHPICDAIAGIDKSSNLRVLVDLRQVSFLGSVEIGDLVRAYNEGNRGGRDDEVATASRVASAESDRTDAPQ